MAQELQVDAEDLDRVRHILHERYNPRDHEEAQELILGALQDAQHILGWIPLEAAQIVADHLGVSVNRVYGLLTFYADFRTEKPGKHHLLLCHGAACFVAGSLKLIEELRDRYGIEGGQTTEDGELTVQIVNGCLGVCDLAPLIQMNHHDYYGNLDVDCFNEVITSVIERGPAMVNHETH